VGQLHHPSVPSIEGQEAYEGAAFHSARWDHGQDLRGKRVAVVGSAASAVQIVPELVETAGCLTVYQRSPNWILPKGDRPYTRLEKAVGRALPPVARAYRAGLWAMGEYGLYPMIRGRPLQRWIGEALCKRAIARAVSDPALRAKLVPSYPIGAKRILLSDRFYPALARPNVELVTEPIERLTREGIVAGGAARAHDAVVYATGFRTNPFVDGIEVVGEGGRTLREHWRAGAHAYLGVATAGFPNLFMLYGPNTNTGHTSIVYKHEAQAGLILRLIEAAGEDAVRVDPAREDAFNAELQERLARLAWAKVEASWYKDGDRITNNWPGGSAEYRRRLAEDDLSAFGFAA
jgi:cation diffusion facilitator CzcD-associated flavoprotein CzcO